MFAKMEWIEMRSEFGGWCKFAGFVKCEISLHCVMERSHLAASVSSLCESVVFGNQGPAFTYFTYVKTSNWYPLLSLSAERSIACGEP